NLTGYVQDAVNQVSGSVQGAVNSLTGEANNKVQGKKDEAQKKISSYCFNWVSRVNILGLNEKKSE
ncbi:hypothetical protein EDC94DRAFT_531503, partial [Helicostylum pulchrum]